MERINIVMAVYNGEKYIDEQIQSILDNTFQNIRLFIYDDGSKDGTEEIVQKFMTNDTRGIYYMKNEKNKGLVRNFLEGVKSIETFGKLDKNDYFMFCDQDDVWLRDKIQKTLEQMKRTENDCVESIPVGVFTDAYVVDEQLGIMNPSFFKSNGLNTTTLDLNHILMENRMIGCTVMFNYSLYEKLYTLPKHARFHDWWIGLIAASFGKISFLNEPTILYRQHGGNMVGNKSFYGYVRKSIRTLKEQRSTILESIKQSQELYQIYSRELKEDKKETIEVFNKLMTYSWLKRRYMVLMRGYLKSGLTRNMGLLFII